MIAALERGKHTALSLLEDARNVVATFDPAFDRTIYPGYARLPAAEREIHRISATFESTQKLTNFDASKERVLNAMRSSEVFHFAGHYVYSSRNPMLSGMLLAGDENSLLTNAEIARRRFPRLRLVVLSAFKTGSRRKPLARRQRSHRRTHGTILQSTSRSRRHRPRLPSPALRPTPDAKQPRRTPSTPILLGPLHPDRRLKPSTVTSQNASDSDRVPINCLHL